MNSRILKRASFAAIVAATVYGVQPALSSLQPGSDPVFRRNAAGAVSDPTALSAEGVASNAVTPEGGSRASYGSLPLSFELNEGQTDDAVKFLARAGGYLLFLTPTEAVMALDGSAASGTEPSSTVPQSTVVRMKLEGANPAPSVEGLDQSMSKSNYFGGPDPAQWRTDIPNYARVRYGQVYPGIDMVYYGTRRQLEYDFVVAPGVDTSVVQLAFSGIEGFEISTTGDLLLHTAQGDMRQRKPVAYQYVNGARREVSASYIPSGVSGIGFRIGDYDHSRPLVIDPVLVYSTYLGGSGFDQGYAIAVDSLGSAYVTGTTAAVDFPTTPGAFQTTYGGGDTFITKLNAMGSDLVYSARFGGNFDDFGRAIALDAAGNAYITGWTVCRATTCTFPTVGAFQPDYGGGYNDAFVTKINGSGSALVYSTYLGGGQILNATDDWGEGIAVDNAGRAYVTGYTYAPDFPVTTGAYDTSRAGLDAFVTKFAADGASLVYSTFIGGPAREQGRGIAVDASGNAYVTGSTESTDNPFTSQYDGFPVTPGAFQTRGSFDAFVTKLGPQGSALVYSTYLGGNVGVDRGWAIAVDDRGSAHVAGDTTSTDFPVADAVQEAYGGGGNDAFVTRLNVAGSALAYSTFLGGSGFDEGRGLALSESGDAFATGSTSSYDFPTASPLQGSNGGGSEHHDDAFVLKLAAGDVPVPGVALRSLTLEPTQVLGGSPSTGIVTLDGAAPSGGLVVELTRNKPSVASVPDSVTVPEGASRASFTVTTTPVAGSKSVDISATHAGITMTAVLTVEPPETADTVAVTLAQYRASRTRLAVQATSTSTTARLRAYVTVSGRLIGTLVNDGGGHYSGRFSWPNKPQKITVRSSLGGSDTRAVTTR